MADIVDDAVVIKNRVERALREISGLCDQLKMKRRQMDKISPEVDKVGLCFVDGRKDKTMGLEIDLPTSLVYKYLREEADRLEKELEEMIAPYRNLVNEPLLSPFGEAVMAMVNAAATYQQINDSGGGEDMAEWPMKFATSK